MPQIPIFGCGMWQTPHTRHTQRTSRRGTHLGLFACVVAVLLLGVVIGRVSMARDGSNEVYLRNSEPTPTHAAAGSRRYRPPLDHVMRAHSPTASTPAGSITRPTRKPSTMIDGSAGDGPQWNSFTPETTTGDSGGGNDVTGFPGMENEVVRLVNAERRKKGCAALRVDLRLVQSARVHSAEMATTNHFEHSSPNGGTPWDRMGAAGYKDGGAENIARGYQTAEEAVQGWMASPGHRNNILNCQLVATGVGVNLGTGGPWWTEDFGYS